MQRGLVLEDQPPLAQWLVATLEECFPGIRVAHAPTLAAGLRLAAAESPDIALVDLGLPDGSGIELIRELAAHHPACHIVVTTIYADDQHLFSAPNTRNTAHEFVKSVYRKLKVSSRAEATLEATRLGLVNPHLGS